MLAWDSKLSRGATGTRVLIPAADAAVTSSFNEAATHIGSLPPASPLSTHQRMLSFAADAVNSALRCQARGHKKWRRGKTAKRSHSQIVNHAAQLQSWQYFTAASWHIRQS